ncbi:YbaB/EbfC family nucleoid-associated protein [Rubinisphaera italica]|uniref:Nucleoid-associated protein Pan54_25150 n=1 Tax=Rubinisphaera italica TaxID=2527969 RepID=A0A5C5XGA4_9PLAN|nr:YbaB/EbfC family nucleoid-associated protein [Rubinisphaera italica]TWT61778.1 Nucleoid-associated protein YbaB [Rubinisphaera italica]|tara:strand:- start:176 stop:526 length:351 start_codon:yes stop_codon:yes gene_type:complete
MFKGLGNLASMMKNAQEIQSKMSDMQNSLKDVIVEGEAGGGMVKVTANGHQEIVSCTIEPSLMETGDKELIEELFVSAGNAAMLKAKEAAAEKMSELTSGMNIPGLSDAMANFGKQ